MDSHPPICIFCSSNSSTSRSVEHVVPESLGNVDHVLPRGIVCDTCNNYFASKVEQPFLEAPAISRLRFEQAIPSKRRRVPPARALLLPGQEIEIHRTFGDGHLQAHQHLEAALPKGVLGPMNMPDRGTLLLIHSGSLPMPDDRVVARFLAKMALEAVALRLLPDRAAINEIAKDSQLDPLRFFARRGQPNNWPFHFRRIHASDQLVPDRDGNSYQTLHEFDFLVTAQNECYFVFALFGMEFTINIGGP